MKFARKQLAAAAIAMIATTVHAADPVPAFEPDPCPDGDAVLAAQTPADKALQLRVEGALAVAGLDRLTEVEVAVIGTTVCLRGRAANTTDYETAEATVAKLGGVAQVENRLRIPLAE